VPSLGEIRTWNLKHVKVQWITSAIFIIYSTEQQRFCDVGLGFRFLKLLCDGMLTGSRAILKGDWSFIPIQFKPFEC
jgi:hypothetical protein